VIAPNKKATVVHISPKFYSTKKKIMKAIITVNIPMTLYSANKNDFAPFSINEAISNNNSVLSYADDA